MYYWFLLFSHQNPSQFSQPFFWINTHFLYSCTLLVRRQQHRNPINKIQSIPSALTNLWIYHSPSNSTSIQKNEKEKKKKDRWKMSLKGRFFSRSWRIGDVCRVFFWSLSVLLKITIEFLNGFQQKVNGKLFIWIIYISLSFKYRQGDWGMGGKGGLDEQREYEVQFSREVSYFK